MNVHNIRNELDAFALSSATFVMNPTGENADLMILSRRALINSFMDEQIGQLQELHNQLNTMKKTLAELVELIKQDDLPKAKTFLTLIEGGLSD